MVSFMFTWGILRFPCGFPDVNMGNLEVSIWFPLSLHLEIWVSLMFHFGNLWFPCRFPNVFPEGKLLFSTSVNVIFVKNSNIL